jgi:hypothetical protein
MVHVTEETPHPSEFADILRRSAPASRERKDRRLMFLTRSRYHYPTRSIFALSFCAIVQPRGWDGMPLHPSINRPGLAPSARMAGRRCWFAPLGRSLLVRALNANARIARIMKPPRSNELVAARRVTVQPNHSPPSPQLCDVSRIVLLTHILYPLQSMILTA